MTTIARRAVLSVLLVASAALAVPALGSAGNARAAKTTKVKMRLVGKLSGITITGTAKGSPFGNCKNKATLIIPKNIGVWTCPGGKVRFTAIGSTGAANVARGTWKITSGTGKFKGAKGTGKFNGLQSTGTFTYTGSVSY